MLGTHDNCQLHKRMNCMKHRPNVYDHNQPGAFCVLIKFIDSIVLFCFVFFQLLLLLVAVSYSNGRFYQTIRTNEAREKTAEDHSLSRFMASKMDVGDDFEQLADLVPKHKRQQRTWSVTFDERERIATYLNDHEPSQGEQIARDICTDLRCFCAHGPRGRCVCECN